MDQVLLVDGDEGFCRDMAERLTRRGFLVSQAGTALEGLRMVQKRAPKLVLTEAVLPDGDGFPLLEAAQGQEGYTPVVVVSETFSPELVFSAISRGAYDCLPKPVDDPALDDLLGRLQGEGRPSLRCRTDRDTPLAGAQDEMVVGRCGAMIQALKTAGAVADTDATVLLKGESGTGKELFARAIHQASVRPGPFVAVNCAAVVETLTESELFGHERGAFTGAVERRPGCFEQADGGTLFLDEIGDAPPAFQAKLLRVLDRGEFYRVGGQELIHPDVRVVAATNSDLDDLVASGRFRGDLFYRLCEIAIHLPPLRERRSDIPPLVRRTLVGINQRLHRKVWGVSEDALERLMSYHWPGNVRELQNVITRAAMLCRGETILPVHLCGLRSEAEPEGLEQVPTLAEMERDHIARVLHITGWNRGRACQLLGITRPTLRRKMRYYGLVNAEGARLEATDHIGGG